MVPAETQVACAIALRRAPTVLASGGVVFPSLSSLQQE